jgi:Skp family chaperone for outer membrane proteins
MRTKTSLLGGVAVGVMLAMAATAPVQAKTVKKTAVSETQKEIDELREELQTLKDRLDEQTQINLTAKAQVQAAQADAAAAKASAAQSETELKTAQAQLIQQLPAQIDTKVNTAVAANKPKTDKIYYKGISITMGGFAAAESAYRDHDQTADIGSSFAKLPFANDRAGHTGETTFTGRQSRYTILAQGDVNKSTTASFYGEFDFLGAAQTANSNESNSYQPRIRVLYGQVDWNDSGWHILGGQNWSLVTLQNNGISPRSEVIPSTIDAQYVAGFQWARQPQFRITKDFNKELWLALSVENPQTTISMNGAGSAQSGGVATGVTDTVNQPPTSQFYSGTNYSLNAVPDVVGKVAWEKKIGDTKVHLEGFGIYRTFASRVNYTAAAAATLGLTAGNQTNTMTGGGGGGSIALFDVVPKHLDLQASVMAGNGIGRYGSGQLSDATARPDGSLVGIPETMWLAGGTFHANPAWDFYAYAGREQENAKLYSLNATTMVGYGTLPGSNNAGCLVEGGSCSALTKSIEQYAGGFWWKFYQGSFGRAQWGVQYSYTTRTAFPDAVGIAPVAHENMVFTSFRFYPF